MSVVAPIIRKKFDSLPPELRQAVLNTGMKLNTMTDLMNCLEHIIAEGEKEE